MSDQLVVFGSGGHAKVVVEAVLARTPDRDIMLVDDDPNANSRRLFGIGVIGARDQLDNLKGAPVALAIGDNQSRFQLMAWLADGGYALETVIHPAAIIGESVQIDPGAFIGAGAIAIAEAHIGRGAIINTGASVDHDCDIGECAHVAPGVHLCGKVHIGARSLVGVGSSVCPGVNICQDVVIGAGTVVLSEIKAPGKFVGNPARRLQ